METKDNSERIYTHEEVMKYFEVFSDLSQKYCHLRLSQTCMNPGATNSEKSDLIGILGGFDKDFDGNLVEDLCNQVESFYDILNSSRLEVEREDRYVPTAKDMQEVGRRLMEADETKVAHRIRFG